MSSKLRMSGLVSGIDTESIISALVSTRQAKVDKTKGEQTKLSWKQEIWKDLNTQLKGLQSTVSNLRFSSSFAKKTTNVSNPSKANVITGDKASTAVQSLKINQLAKTSYLTGGTVSKEDGENATALTKLGELGFKGTGSFDIKDSKGNVIDSVSVDSDTTISNVISKLQAQGLNASFDEKNQRLFVSANGSGADKNFSLSATGNDGNDALAKLGLQTSSYFNEIKQMSEAEKTNLINNTAEARFQSYKKMYEDNSAKIDTLNLAISDTMDKYGIASDISDEDYDSIVSESKEKLEDLKKQLDELDKDDADYETKKSELEENIKTATEKVSDLSKLSNDRASRAELLDKQNDLATNYLVVTPQEDGTVEIFASDKIKDNVSNELNKQIEEAVTKTSDSKTQFAVHTQGSDAEITLNGATFTSSTNVFEINGLTITAMATTDEGEELTLTTQQDTSGIYVMIKEFMTKYNNVVNQLDKLYNAESAKGFNPLTDEEKDSMSETEAEKYEQKIKDSLLRRDSSISAISNGLYDVMASGISVGNKTMYLSDFGINTLDYFAADDNQKHAFHIDGDEKDETTSGNADKLKALISSDPDTVVSFFTQLSQSLYKKMDNLSTSVNGTRSYGSFYEDKKMTSDYNSYKNKIADLEKKVADYEDKLYKQYGSMETALAKLQSNTSALTGLLGS